MEVRQLNIVVLLAGAAHIMTWLVLLWLLFGPVYQGVSVTAVSGQGGVSESRRTSASLVAVNGLRVLPIILAPVALTGTGLLAAFKRGRVEPGWRVLMWRAYLWASALLLLAISAISILSIGPFYLPPLVLLLASAIVSSRKAATTSE